MIYRTVQGDMVDAICKARYGSEDPVEQVYEANPHLAALGAILPEGTLVTLPALTPKQERRVIRLWGAGA